ncbi:hypothetical protein BU16DRAFT_148184 [Lophium mytilinum]|uniref:CoA-dependent acyltransferase n=1 Tax=Lophium mytilinum TaxID=390894 RepID=A0A6A6QE49_9PEZI|nr:hypothetical protein BU16DRAFT_148184 [Lophium mytilinum]
MSWSIASDNSRTRPLDNAEIFFESLTPSGLPPKLQHWAIAAVLQLRLPASVPDHVLCLQRAWLLLRRLHPSLGGKLLKPDDSSTPILSIPPLDPDEWISTSFFTHSNTSATEIFPTLGVTPTVTCHYFPDTREVLFHIAHWRMDGIGTQMLTHYFLTLLSSVLALGPTADLDAYAPTLQPCLNPGLDAIIGPAATLHPLPVHLQTAAQELISHFVGGLPSIGLPTLPNSEQALPANTFNTPLTLTPATTTAVIAACKARGISVTTAVHASLVRVTGTYPQHAASSTSFASFVPKNLRKALPTPYSTDAYAVGVFMTGFPVRVDGAAGPERKGWAEVAQELHAGNTIDMEKLPTADGQAVRYFDIMGAYVPGLVGMFAMKPLEGWPLMQTPGFSSLGRVEEYVREEYGVEGGGEKVEVEEWWLATEMLTREIGVHLWTWRGRLRLMGSFNESFYEKGFVAEVLEQVKGELLKGLGIEE